MADVWLWFCVILGLIFGIISIVGIDIEDQMRRNAWRSYSVYDDEDNFMDDLEDWVLVEDFEEELEDEG